MRLKKFFAVSMAMVMTVSMAGCGGEDKPTSNNSNTGGDEKTNVKEYADVKLGEDYKDLKAEISIFNHRTDMQSDDYKGKKWDEYLKEFNEMYPDIKINITTDTNYADDALTHLQSGNYETIMMIPQVDKSDLSEYFLPFGDLETMKGQINYATAWEYGGDVYGVPSMGTTQGIVYNKKVFEQAGIEEFPTTPDGFIDALKKVKENTDVEAALYTNYAAEWPMGAWDAYIGNNATGDVTYMNQKLLHTKEPFKDYGDGTHAYAVYKVLYDAVAEGLTEDDYTTTDWEGCKGKLNRGEIGCMVLGSWAYPQMEAAGDNPDDIGYKPFPISVDGKQYATCGADYSYAINVNASEDEQAAAMVFIKWLTEESGYSYNEDGLPVKAGETESKISFEGVDFLEDEPAVSGEEDLLNELNSESELNLNAGGNSKIQKIVEHAANGDQSFDDIMAEWNEAWSDAQESAGVEVTE